MSILPRNQLSLTETFTEYSIIIENSGIKAYGIPCCPHDFILPMKPESSTSHLCGGSKTFKFVCPKIQWKKSEDGKHRRRHNCENPCTDSSFG